ncbi:MULTISPECIES: PPOX class F420-dependent oxidoreductase [Nocardia]|jgi:pyridoxamine 5'-phosphate oxidase family protein|uniref:PPOX class F420-dependent oxidoreductase n=1 Tax=Nocardia TaxID=1817 RepID=UPI001893CB19|nr:PPOX class F420-dependent oxidoreductase [Nocardia nova]MBF6145308.1 PPOX class F420-dependent oxidoreductase [Nocardia nova]MBV7704870.1 PPOX class F420-dependent oxidoreductase [Nocardia nova]MDN2497751.1 PPOX class F420-dependent oxidoreductase [Nocardia nova]
MIATLSAAQIEYLAGQRLGRLATIRPDGSPQNNPVGFRYNAALGTIDIAGHNMGASQKFRNLAKEERVAFVVDDIASVNPWQVRCLEIRGVAQALRDVDTYLDGGSRELIRITPQRVLGFGID